MIGNLSGTHIGSFVLANEEGRIDRMPNAGTSGTRWSHLKSRAAEVQGHLNFAGGFFRNALKFLVSSFPRP